MPVSTTIAVASWEAAWVHAAEDAWGRGADVVRPDGAFPQRWEQVILAWARVARWRAVRVADGRIRATPIGRRGPIDRCGPAVLDYLDRVGRTATTTELCAAVGTGARAALGRLEAAGLVGRAGLAYTGRGGRRSILWRLTA